MSTTTLVQKFTQPWIYSKSVDSYFILFPSFLALFAIFLFPGYFQSDAEVNLYAWVGLVLLIDVAHVYSTLYRTYFDKDTYVQQKTILLIVPLFAWIGGVMLYSLSDLIFWRCLAYIAVFHFIRQQYGFMRIYSRKENVAHIYKKIDTIAIYAATVYPIIFWHTKADRNFDWFIKNDFYYFQSELIQDISFYIYSLVVIAYITKEIVMAVNLRFINLPRILIISGTFLTWYFGIVHFNGDLIFTLTNIVSHGIPYMALIWIYGKKKYSSEKANTTLPIISKLYGKWGFTIFILIVSLLAFVEEGIWDRLVWQDHEEFFNIFSFIPVISDKATLSLIVPLLALPQLTHYIIDGFIWKIAKDKFNWKKYTLGKSE